MMRISCFALLVACTSRHATVGNGLIAFPASDADDHQQLYLIEPDGSDATQITFDGESSLPSWSPDGQQLVFVTREPNAAPMLTIADADGGNARALVVGDAPTWGPDDRIAFSIGDPAEIWVVDAGGGTPTQLTHGGDHRGRVHASWSGDGSRLVYMELAPQDPSTDDTSNGCPALPVQPELWSVAADGSDPRPATTSGGYYNVDDRGATINSAFDANAPGWSPASDAIVFWGGQEQCFGQIWSVAHDGSHRVQLTHAPAGTHNDDPEFSPDGTKVLFTTDRAGRPELWMMNADGSDQHFVAANHPGPGPGDSAWQPVVEAR